MGARRGVNENIYTFMSREKSRKTPEFGYNGQYIRETSVIFDQIFSKVLIGHLKTKEQPSLAIPDIGSQ